MILGANDRIDLQLHTIYSDGHWQPTDLFEYLAQERFRLVSITDHDSMEHLDDLRTLGDKYGVYVLPGVEMTTDWHGKSAHLLCYAVAFRGDTLGEMGRATVASQLANTQAVYEELLRRGYRFAPQTTPPTRPIDNARMLQSHGYAASLDGALRVIADAGYRSIRVPLAEAVAAAHADGALAVLAHPGRGGGEIHRYDIPLLSDILTDVALDGIEARYPTYSEDQVAAYSVFARERGLLVSAGSDSHGPAQRLPIAYPASTCSDLLARCDVFVN
ncbi:MAG TPA: PHP domain-containing protein [Ktedonobacterales bacterium]|nr:PHP domain-containing protein [Ktedonobacterales bacterium]